MKKEVECGLNDKWRRAFLASAIGTGLSLVLSPWLEAVLAPASVLFAASFQALSCNKRLEIEVKREVVVKRDKAFVRLISSEEDALLKDFPSASPISGEPVGRGKVTYVIDVEENPFVFWPGTMVRLERGACACSGFVELTSFVSSWKLEALGLVEPVEVEGGYSAVPEVEGVREYRPGDDVRLIIWKSLYKPGGPRVKEMKKVTEISGLKKGITTFYIDLGPWSENACFRVLGSSLASYLREVGLKEVKGKADVAVVGPGSSLNEANLYLLLNPLACLPPMEEFEVVELVRRRALEEFLETERRLKELGEVRAVPWSVPPEHMP